MALPCFGAISSAKMGFESASECIWRGLRPFGVRVSVVDPGGIGTPGNGKMRRDAQQVTEHMEPGIVARYAEPMRRFTRFADWFHEKNPGPDRVARAWVSLEARREGGSP